MLVFPVDRRGSAMGIFGLVIAFAPAIGPTVAGFVIDQADWHILFYLCLLYTSDAAAVAADEAAADAEGAAPAGDDAEQPTEGAAEGIQPAETPAQ